MGGTFKKTRTSKDGFTLVELIVVITILAILGTIAFVSLQGYSNGARDSTRLTDINSIYKALNLYNVNSGKYPVPENISRTGVILGTNVSYVGKVGKNIASLIKLNTAPIDPLTNTEYPYGTTYNYTDFQIAGSLENTQAYTPLLQNAYADNGYVAKVVGSYRGVIKFTVGSNVYVSNVPSLIFNSGSSTDLVNTEPYFVVNNGKNLPYILKSGDSQFVENKASTLSLAGSSTGVVVAEDVTNKTKSQINYLENTLGYKVDLIGQSLFGKAWSASTTGGSSTGSTLTCGMVKDIDDNGPGYVVQLPGKTIFSNTTGLWVTDGTVAGTTLLKTFTQIQNMVGGNGMAFFRGNDGTGKGEEIWRTDGTIAGTILLKDIVVGAGNSTPQDIIMMNNIAYFRADDGSGTYNDLWKSDGTPAGTVLVKAHVGFLVPIEMNNFLYFLGADTGLWKTDGTTAGTVLVKGSPLVVSFIFFAKNSNRIYFIGGNSYPNTELWTSDGTTVGTTLLKTFPSGFRFNFLTDSNGIMYFDATDANGNELWKTDGTLAGTVMVKDIEVGANGSSPTQYISVPSGYFLFTAHTSSSGTELWKTDGTAVGTVLLKDINPGVSNSNPNEFALFNGKAYFWADDGAGYELWTTDGTTAGTIKVPGMPSGDGWMWGFDGPKPYFAKTDGTHGYELWTCN